MTALLEKPSDFTARRADIERRRHELAPLHEKRNQLKNDAEQKDAAANASREFRERSDEFLLQKYRLSEEDLQARKVAARDDVRANQAAIEELEKFEAANEYLTSRTRILDDAQAAIDAEEFLYEVRCDLTNVLVASAELVTLQERLNKHRENRLAKQHLPANLGWPAGTLTPIEGDPRRPSASTIFDAVRLHAEIAFAGTLRDGDPVKPLAKSGTADLAPRLLAPWLG